MPQTSEERARENTRLEIGSHFIIAARTGFWGTCGDCPKDKDGRQYPEFCVHKARYDHVLKPEDLGKMWGRYMDMNLERIQEREESDRL